MVCVSVGGTGGPNEDPFWKRLDFGWGPADNSETLHTTPDGWVLLGWACSSTPRDTASFNGLCSDFRFQLQQSKYVGALVARTFKDEDGWRRAMKEHSKAIQDAAKGGGA